MVGTKRSGRHNLAGGGTPRTTGSGSPVQPDDQTDDEAYFWRTCIGPAHWLTGGDTPAATACCELWGFLRA